MDSNLTDFGGEKKKKHNTPHKETIFFVVNWF